MDRTQGSNYDDSTGVRKFTDGPPGTVVEEDFLNGVQEELIAVIKGTGQTPSNSDQVQVVKSIATFGALIGGKMVPSTAGNALTVALKTLSGNDPSSTEPVYVRINDTIRTVSSALYITMTGGTNTWNQTSNTHNLYAYLCWSAAGARVEIGLATHPNYRVYPTNPAAPNRLRVAAASGSNAAASLVAGDKMLAVSKILDVISSSADNYTGVNATGQAIPQPSLDTEYINMVGDVHNLGLTLSGGTLTITDMYGNALSSTNYGLIKVPGVTAGKIINIKVTSGMSFTTDQTANWEYGITAGANWANDRPFFLYAVNRGDTDINGADGNSAFFISDVWNLATTPVAGKCGDIDAVAGTDEQGSIMILDSVTEANYAALPCICIGAFRAQYTTADHKWTVQTLSNKDGIGQRALDATFSTTYTMPVSQNGAESGKHFTSTDGATALTFTATNTVNYRIMKDGKFTCTHYHDSQSANGADGTAVKWAMPYSTTTNYERGIGSGMINNTTSIISTYITAYAGYANYVNAGANAAVLDNVFAHTDDYFWAEFVGHV